MQILYLQIYRISVLSHFNNYFCRAIMQQLAEFGHRQQEELLNRQKQLELAHDHLVENSKTILAAQVSCL